MITKFKILIISWSNKRKKKKHVKPRQSYQYFVIQIYNWWKRQIETFKRTRWIERDKPWERWWLQFQNVEESFSLKKNVRGFKIKALGCLKSWMDLDQIQIHLFLRHPNKGFGFGPSNPNPKIQTGCQQIDSVIYPRTSATKVRKKRWRKRRTFFRSDAMRERRRTVFFFFFLFFGFIC